MRLSLAVTSTFAIAFFVFAACARDDAAARPFATPAVALDDATRSVEPISDAPMPTSPAVTESVGLIGLIMGSDLGGDPNAPTAPVAFA